MIDSTIDVLDKSTNNRKLIFSILVLHLFQRDNLLKLGLALFFIKTVLPIRELADKYARFYNAQCDY